MSLEMPARGWWLRLIRLGRFLFWYRDYLFPLVFLGLLFTTTPEVPFGSTPLGHWLDLVGLMIVLLGQGCRLLTMGSVDNIRRRGHRKAIAATSLIRHGVFAHTRNPFYLGNILIITGVVLLANCRWWYVLVLPGFVGVYTAIVCAEEEGLRLHFGRDFVEYVHAVPRFIPTFRGLGQTLTASPCSWRRALRKESGVLCSWLFAVIVVLVWKQWHHIGLGGGTTGSVHLFLSLLLMLLTYRGVRWLQRRGKACLRDSR